MLLVPSGPAWMKRSSVTRTTHLERLQGRVVDVRGLEGGAGHGGLEVDRLHLGVELHEDGLDAVGDDVAGVVDVVQVLA